MSTEFELFSGTNFSDLMRDVYHNSKKKSRQIDTLIKSLEPMIKNVGDATVIVPLIKEYLDVGVKNDDNLLKLATVIQRIMNKQLDLTEDTSLLSDEEKQELMDSLEEAAASLQDKSDEMQVDKIRKRIES